MEVLYVKTFQIISSPILCVDTASGYRVTNNVSKRCDKVC